MEIFYSNEIHDGEIILPEGESNHCVRVLRHVAGDEIHVSCSDGNLYRCVLCDASPGRAVLKILSVEGGFGSHPYYLHIAIAPTKNIDRFEWFLEKATEIGVDEITPLLCDHSIRKIVKLEREKRVILSAAKQSLKGTVPQLNDMMTVSELVSQTQGYDLRGIAFCDRELVNSAGEGVTRIHIADALEALKGMALPRTLEEFRGMPLPSANGVALPSAMGMPLPRILIMIGPEGDFSRDELSVAADSALKPISLGEARLRTETAGVMAAASVALSFR